MPFQEKMPFLVLIFICVEYIRQNIKLLSLTHWGLHPREQYDETYSSQWRTPNIFPVDTGFLSSILLFRVLILVGSLIYIHVKSRTMYVHDIYKIMYQMIWNFGKIVSCSSGLFGVVFNHWQQKFDLAVIHFGLGVCLQLRKYCTGFTMIDCPFSTHGDSIHSGLLPLNLGLI